MFSKNLMGSDIDEDELNKPVREVLIRLFAVREYFSFSVV